MPQTTNHLVKNSGLGFHFNGGQSTARDVDLQATALLEELPPPAGPMVGLGLMSAAGVRQGSTNWPGVERSGEATLATKGARQSAGSVAGTNVPFGGAAGQSAIRSAAFHARNVVSGVGGGAS